jgi:hypothetical protein
VYVIKVRLKGENVIKDNSMKPDCRRIRDEFREKGEVGDVNLVFSHLSTSPTVKHYMLAHHGPRLALGCTDGPRPPLLPPSTIPSHKEQMTIVSASSTLQP